MPGIPARQDPAGELPAAGLLKAIRGWQLEWNAEQLLRGMAKDAVELLGFQRSAIFLLDRNGVACRASWPPELLQSPAFATESRGIADSVVRSGRPAFVHHVPAAAAARIAICVPLIASRGNLGALYADSSALESDVSHKYVEFSEMFGLQAAAALEHALLYQSAITDPLTGLFSHRHFQQEAEQAVRHAYRTEEPLSLLMMDLDKFKPLNDTHGHEAGNQCLMRIAGLLRESLRINDLAARFGGDEFEVLLPGTGGADAQTVAEKLRQKIAAEIFAGGHAVTATIGIATYPENAADAQALFLRADEALYEAKESGRNRSLRTRHAEPGPQRPRAASRYAGLSGLVPALKTMPPQAQSQPGAGSGSGAGLGPEPAAVIGEETAAVEKIDGHPVIRRLGLGSSGEVLLVRQPELDRDIALKRPLTAHLTEAQRAAFEREARVTAALDHPGVISIHTLGRDSDNRTYYTMKPLQGRSLVSIIDGRARGDAETLQTFTLNRLLEILQRVSETVAYAHSRGIAHGDLSSANIVVGRFGEVTIIDWASAPSCAAAPGTEQFVVAGSPAFAVPEVVGGEASSGGLPADVFSLGTILYIILTGRPPFLHKTPAASLKALLDCDFTPPDAAASGAAIDPILSGLCADALRRKPAERLSALQFSEKISRFVRREAEWVETRFGPGGRPLAENDWRTKHGSWAMRDGEWACGANGENVLLWNTPVSGSFRFACEAWSENGAELSLVGHRPSAGISPQADIKYAGYCFQFGADWNSCAKFTRHISDVIVIPGCVVEPRRKYLIELEYDDEEGQLHGYLDGRRIVSYRELFSFPGSGLGLYSFGAGAHFRPLYVRSRRWTLMIPAMRVADRYFEREHYAEALEAYQEIAERLPERSQAHEALLKSAMCFIQLKQPGEARKIFEGLAGTPLGPYALAEQGMLDLSELPGADPRRGVAFFKRLLDEFPSSPAKARLYDATTAAQRTYSFYGNTLDEDLNLRVAILKLNFAQGLPPTGPQLQRHLNLEHFLVNLGRYDEALEFALSVQKSLMPGQRASDVVPRLPVASALATGREDLLPGPGLKDRSKTWDSGFFAQWVVRGGATRWFMDHWFGRGIWSKNFNTRIFISPLCIALAAGDRAAAGQVLDAQMKVKIQNISPFTYHNALNLAFAGESEMLRRYAHESDAPPEHQSETATALAAEHIFNRRFAEAAPYLKKQGDRRQRVRLLLRAFAASLGYLPGESIEQVRAQCLQWLCGPERELAEIFLDGREPEPSALWPHPLYRPDRRVLLSLWLEARGDKHRAREIAAPCRDERFGTTHCQTFVRALLERLA